MAIEALRDLGRVQLLEGRVLPQGLCELGGDTFAQGIPGEVQLLEIRVQHEGLHELGGALVDQGVLGEVQGLEGQIMPQDLCELGGAAVAHGVLGEEQPLEGRHLHQGLRELGGAAVAHGIVGEVQVLEGRHMPQGLGERGGAVVAQGVVGKIHVPEDRVLLPPGLREGGSSSGPDVVAAQNQLLKPVLVRQSIGQHSTMSLGQTSVGECQQPQIREACHGIHEGEHLFCRNVGEIMLQFGDARILPKHLFMQIDHQLRVVVLGETELA
mmetsp:Transcript_99164/g.318178  ORF Transcript_99164/g.318178 Transcript_99164/m.318178 type:complete len:269 (-) Transcript_99164:1159-1965(-)